jgi:hypothetical protein
MMVIQSLQEELRTRHKQQHQNGTNEHSAGTTNSSTPAELSRVAMQLPPFWAKRPTVWFAQAEAQFTLIGISSEQTKFCCVILQLDHQYTTEVEDITTSPPKHNPYTTLTTELVRLCRPHHRGCTPADAHKRRASPKHSALQQYVKDL